LDDEKIRYGPRRVVATKLDAYRGVIDARLRDYPELTAVRLFDEVQAAGYAGSYTQVKEYVRQVRPMPAAEPTARFETPPGHQAQVDFAHFTLPWGKRYALVVVLGYSRLLWVEYHQRQTMDVVIRGLEAAFVFFGGVPAELLFDQMKAVVIDDQRLQGGELLKNPEFMRFAEHWGFTIRACRPYRARTKGKVERPIRYLRQSFFYGRQFLNDEDLNSQVRSWLERTANVRKHRTIDEQPRVRFERDERAVLKPLAARPYRSLILPPQPETPARPARIERPLPRVERRPLAVYGQLSRSSP
jgi:transposase